MIINFQALSSLNISADNFVLIADYMHLLNSSTLDVSFNSPSQNSLFELIVNDELKI